MKHRHAPLAALLLIIFMATGCQLKESTEGMVMVPETDFYFRLPENYGVVHDAGRMLWIQEEIVIEGTVYPFISPNNLSIRIGTTIFEVSEFQRGPDEFDPIDTFGRYYFEPEAIASKEFEIYLAKAMQQELQEAQFLVDGIAVVGRSGVYVNAYGEFSEQDQAYAAVKEILQSLRRVRD